MLQIEPVLDTDEKIIASKTDLIIDIIEARRPLHVIKRLKELNSMSDAILFETWQKAMNLNKKNKRMIRAHFPSPFNLEHKVNFTIFLRDDEPGTSKRK